jgi:hypothetical protein
MGNMISHLVVIHQATENEIFHNTLEKLQESFRSPKSSLCRLNSNRTYLCRLIRVQVWILSDVFVRRSLGILTEN